MNQYVFEKHSFLFDERNVGLDFIFPDWRIFLSCSDISRVALDLVPKQCTFFGLFTEI